MREFHIKWYPRSIGSEFLKREWFQSGKRRTVEHEIKVGNESYRGKCTIHMVGLVAILDYENKNRAFNIANNCDTGIAKISFSDKMLSSIEKYEWKSEGSEEFIVANVVIPNEDADFEYLFAEAEGNRKLVAHLRSERSYKLRKKKLDDVSNRFGEIRCELCSVSFEETYGNLGKNFCEVHHSKQLKSGNRITKLNDLNVLCSNCHRMIHRTAKIDGRDGLIMTVSEFAEYLRANGSVIGSELAEV